MKAAGLLKRGYLLAGGEWKYSVSWWHSYTYRSAQGYLV